MPFPLPVRMEALIACQRQCCLCHQRKQTQMTCHHIIPEADGGPDTFDNCISLCTDCLAQVEACMAIRETHFQSRRGLQH